MEHRNASAHQQTERHDAEQSARERGNAMKREEENDSAHPDDNCMRPPLIQAEDARLESAKVLERKRAPQECSTPQWEKAHGGEECARVHGFSVSVLIVCRAAGLRRVLSYKCFTLLSDRRLLFAIWKGLRDICQKYEDVERPTMKMIDLNKYAEHLAKMVRRIRWPSREVTRRLSFASILIALPLAACSSSGSERAQVASIPKEIVRPQVTPLPKSVAPVPQISIPREDILGTDPVDRVVVYKGKRTLLLYRGDRIVKTYRVALGFNPVGHKRQQGDGRTPEGLYFITYKNENSSFHRSLRIDYPSPADVETARSLGIDPGGDIVIHGLPNRATEWERREHPQKDWTNGCIALEDEEIDEIWSVVRETTPIYIYP